MHNDLVPELVAFLKTLGVEVKSEERHFGICGKQIVHDLTVKNMNTSEVKILAAFLMDRGLPQKGDY